MRMARCESTLACPPCGVRCRGNEGLPPIVLAVAHNKLILLQQTGQYQPAEARTGTQQGLTRFLTGWPPQTNRRGRW
jgi:hypothetical protein